MTRGRRKDLTIPPSRALLQQRDYRARKAQYVADLEERVRRTEDENARLRKDLDTLRLRLAAGGTLGPSQEVVAASSELMHQLTTAAASLAKFQQITFNEQAQAQAQAQSHALAQAQMQTQNLQPPPPPELPPIRPPAHDQRASSGPFSTLPPPPSHATPRQPSPPRQTLHPSRHQSQNEYHHHSLSPPASLSGPATAPRDYAHIHTSHSEPSRAPSGPGSPTASSSSSSSMRLTVSHRSHTYTGYNEAESAWGYFDSRDLADDDDEEDELYEDDHTPGGSRHRRHDRGSTLGGHSNGLEHRPNSSPFLSHRMSTLRSTSSSPPTEDAQMRMREDSPMRTR